MVCDQLTVTQAVAPSKAQIFNACWGSNIRGPCGIPPSLPAITPGSTINIVADIANSGGTGRVMVNFKINGVVQHTETNVNLGTYPGGGMWSATYSNFVMPNSNISLGIDAYGYDGVNWNLTDSKSLTISPSVPQCTSISLSPFSSNINTGGKVTLTATVTPGNVAFNVQFKDDKGTVLGTCKTTGAGSVSGGSTCQYIYTAGNTPGTYYVIATSGSCVSTQSAIVVAQPILQYNLNIKVLDKNTNTPVSGATILANVTGSAAQSKVTDSNGLASFRLDAGTINIAISKNGYNSDNEVDSLFSDTDITYYITPIPPVPTVGDIQFVSVPVGAEIFLDGKDTGQKTTMTLSGITAGNHTWTLKLSGYNDSNGSVTVPSGGSTYVYTTLTPVTPTSGSLNIDSTPMGAEVYIDGKDYNVTTSGSTVITNMPPGTHTYTLTMAGFQDKTGTFTITAGQTTYLNVELVPLVTIGSLDISSDPSGARVWIDDKDTGYTTPATINNLIAGDHKYKVILSGYKDVSGGFTIKIGETTPVHLILEKSEGLSGIALALGAGAALVAIVGSIQKKE